jgi:hypothetical protein
MFLSYNQGYVNIYELLMLCFVLQQYKSSLCVSRDQNGS